MARFKRGWMEVASTRATRWTGSSTALGLAVGVILAWGLTGPLFHYSDTWQLVINTGTTIVTFIMVFLIQRAQNKDSLAIQMKLNELLAAVEGASNRLIAVEDLSEEEVRALREHFRTLVHLARGDENFTASHSVEEARSRHRRKRHEERETDVERCKKVVAEKAAAGEAKEKGEAKRLAT